MLRLMQPLVLERGISTEASAAKVAARATSAQASRAQLRRRTKCPLAKIILLADAFSSTLQKAVKL